jgi:carbon-monoxide dehydrogenase large subunit
MAVPRRPLHDQPAWRQACGEAGAVGAFLAVTNAILDALAPLGVADFARPATPERIWRAMNDADRR